MEKIINALHSAAETVKDAASDIELRRFIKSAAAMICESFDNDGKVLVCGNGGSMADAMHFAEEFTGRFRKDRRPLPVMALSDPAYLTCTSNDYGFEEIFARGVTAWGKSNDILIAISTSGNSENVCRAVQVAENKEVKVILLLGKNGGKLKKAGDLKYIVRAKTTDRIQELHMMILHILIESIERRMFPENYQEY